MKPEIKQRIEQLNNGKIPKGYKKTDFGVFPSDWVTDKKLIDIGTFGKGKGIPGNKMQSGGVPCVGYGDIYMKYNHQSFVDEETAKDSQLIKKGTLLFTGTGETAEEIGKCVCYNGDSTIYAGGDIITFVPQDVNPLFLAYQQYQNFSLKKKASFGQGHSVVHIQKESLEKLNVVVHIQKESLEKLNVAYPESKKEQLRIVEILMKWDKAIELYDKQIDALTRYKAVCLRKMIPAKGQNVPEWRFQGFTGAWEQRKLGKLAIFNPKAELPEIFEYVDLESVVGTEMISHRTESKITAPSRAQRLARTGDLFYQTVRPYQKNNYLFEKPDKHYVFSTGYAQMRPLVDGQFLLSLVQNENFVKMVLDNCTGTSYPAINSNDLADIEVLSPTEKEEQRIIGSFFKGIGNLITLHQRKKETIINQRKTLQQYLLNGIVRVKS